MKNTPELMKARLELREYGSILGRSLSRLGQIKKSPQPDKCDYAAAHASLLLSGKKIREIRGLYPELRPVRVKQLDLFKR